MTAARKLRPDHAAIEASRDRDRSDLKHSGAKSPGVGAPSARVLASKGRKSRYVIKFYDHCDPAVRERVGAGIAKIDARPHRDPIWKPIDYRAMPTEAQRLAAAGRVLGFLVPAVDPSEECGESPDKGPHVPMADGRCSLCDRTLATPEPASEPEPVAVQADEPEPTPVAIRKPRRVRGPRVKPSAVIEEREVTMVRSDGAIQIRRSFPGTYARRFEGRSLGRHIFATKVEAVFEFIERQHQAIVSAKHKIAEAERALAWVKAMQDDAMTPDSITIFNDH